ncbi:MAG: hypothetical protein LH606_05945 [Cytophagaceae bacterium]|nr:hypothetical protein [Cytophagaceae bacterium]
MEQKPQSNHRIYLETLRRMTPEERVAKSFELTEFARSLFRSGLRRRFPEASETELDALFFQRLEKCHNRNY